MAGYYDPEHDKEYKAWEDKKMAEAMQIILAANSPQAKTLDTLGSFSSPGVLSPIPQVAKPQAPAPMGYGDMFAQATGANQGKVLGMSAPEFSVLFGRLANAVAPNTMGGRMGAESATTANELIAREREDARPENVAARERLKAIQGFMTPQAQQPQPVQQGQSAPTTNTLNPQTPAGDTRLSLMTAGQILDNQGRMIQAPPITTPTVMSPGTASQIMNHNTTPSPQAPQAPSPTNFMQAEEIAKEAAMTPMQKMERDMKLTGLLYQNKYQELINSGLPAKQASDLAMLDVQNQYYQMKTKLAPRELESQIMNNLTMRFETQRSHQVNEQQAQTFKTANIMTNHEKAIQINNEAADKEAENSGRNKSLIISKGAGKGIVLATGMIKDATALGSQEGVITAKTNLFHQIERGVAAINSAGTNEKNKKAALMNLLGGLESIREVSPLYYEQIISELPARVKPITEQRKIPIVNIGVGSKTTIFDPQSVILEHEKSRGRAK